MRFLLDPTAERGLVGRVVRGAGAAADLAAPGAGLLAPVLDELLEALQVASHRRARHADSGAHLLLEAFRLDVHEEVDLGAALVDGREDDRPVVPGPALALPGDDLVRHLAGNPGGPPPAGPRNLGDPVQALVIQLAYLLDVFHEVWELLELGPLVVCLLDGHRYLYTLLYSHRFLRISKSFQLGGGRDKKSTSAVERA